MKILRFITDRVATKKGAWITLIIWLLLAIGLSAGPQLSDYQVTNFQSLPDEAESIIAQDKLDEYFPNDQGTPGIYVFYNEDGEIVTEDVLEIIGRINEENIEGIEEIFDLSPLPQEVIDTFVSEDGSTMFVPMNLEAGLGNADYADINDATTEIGTEIAAEYDTEFYITGPAGISGDTVKLFESADLVLLFATIGIILLLLIVIYRSPLLAIIPLFATAIVYQVVNQTVAILGANGLEINNSTTSIMSILLFAAVIDYSLFVFSRYREELYNYEDKYEAMRVALRAVGKPVLFAGATI